MDLDTRSTPLFVNTHKDVVKTILNVKMTHIPLMEEMKKEEKISPMAKAKVFEKYVC